jgi:hypothetical protein
MDHTPHTADLASSDVYHLLLMAHVDIEVRIKFSASDCSLRYFLKVRAV